MRDTLASELSNLKRRLAVLFVVAAAAVIAGGGAYWHNYRSLLRTDAENLLLSIERSKAEQFNYWRTDRISDTLSLLDSPFFSRQLNRFADNTEDSRTASLIKGRLEAYLRHNRYTAALLTDAKGKILVSAGLNVRVLHQEGRKLIHSVDSSGKAEIGDLFVSQGESEPHLTLAAAAVREPKRKHLFLLLRIAPKDYLYPLIREWPTNSATGETLLAREENGNVLFLNELRHLKGPQLKLTRPMNAAALPAALAIKGVTGTIRGRDYRGKEVLAAVTTIPGTSWGMVTKMDWDEVMKGSGRVSFLLVLLTLALIGAAGAGAFLLFRLQAEEYHRSYAELESKASRLRINYELFMDRANDAILIFEGENLAIKEANKKGHEMYGYTEEEFSRLKITGLVPSGGAKEQQERLGQVKARPGTILEALHRHKDGTVFPVEISAAFIEQAGATYLFAIIRDISERKRLERTLRKSENDLKEAQRLARIGSWEWDVSTDTITWSAEYYNIYGLSPAQRPPGYADHLKAYTPESAARLDAAVKKNMQTGEPYELDLQLASKEGPTRWITARSETMRDPAGKVIGLRGTAQDITTRKQAEEALLRSEEKLRILINSMPDIVCFKDGEGRWLEANTFDLRLFRLEEVDYRGKKDSELAAFSPFYRDAFMACEGSDEAAWRKGTISRGEETIPIPDGEPLVFDIIKVPLFNADGGRLGLIVVGRDITARKTAESRLEKLNRDLIDSKREMENFLYIATHDLRSPLVNIQGFSQNLERYMAELRGLLAQAEVKAENRQSLDKLTGTKVPEALKFVLESSRKMDALITALLKVSRIGRVEMKPETVDMNELLARIVDSLRYQLENSGGKISCGDLPRCKADPGAISQLFSNLLDNAVKYRSKDRPLAVDVTGTVLEGMALYKVADNGSGIPSLDLHRIWNVFYQPDRSHGKKGEGIGLPMVRRITEKNGGTIRAESKEGEGSVFYVELPAAETEVE